ncbi:class I lanthipeptide [Dyadobacter chenwenxiniae]|uniref:class I lanthipeptide n=1 Tax=Dyadobacter chenwenxiniae TaxID=2906456 RepID=UPI0035B69D11
MKKQATSLEKLSVNKTTVARLTDFFLKDNEKSFTESDTTVNTTLMCKGLTLLKW